MSRLATIHGPFASAVTIDDGGKTYGSWPVILVRVTPESVETMVGTRMGRYGGVAVDPYDGKRFVEERDGWWRARGWQITDPEIPKSVRQTSREGATA